MDQIYFTPQNSQPFPTVGRVHDVNLRRAAIKASGDGIGIDFLIGCVRDESAVLTKPNSEARLGMRLALQVLS
jgi:hypothetical protein